jgi:hypothetical protein
MLAVVHRIDVSVNEATSMPNFRAAWAKPGITLANGAATSNAKR